MANDRAAGSSCAACFLDREDDTLHVDAEDHVEVLLGDLLEGRGLCGARRRSRRSVTTSPPSGATFELASDDSSYITGTELFVDGGFAQV
jgi:hypothetical protein